MAVFSGLAVHLVVQAGHRDEVDGKAQGAEAFIGSTPPFQANEAVGLAAKCYISQWTHGFDKHFPRRCLHSGDVNHVESDTSSGI